MKHNKLLQIGLISLSTQFMGSYAIASPKNCTHSATQLKCLEFVQNYDGDTLTVNIPSTHPLFGQKIKISLSEAKTPSLNSKDKCAKAIADKAKFTTRKMLKAAKYIEILAAKRDRNFGLKGKIMVDGKDLAAELQKAKLAVPTKDYKKTDWCKLK